MTNRHGWLSPVTRDEFEELKARVVEIERRLDRHEGKPRLPADKDLADYVARKLGYRNIADARKALHLTPKDA